jgi:hypothetical protein
MKTNRRSRLTFLVGIFVVLSILLATHANAVRAAISGVYAFEVYVRVQTEIMQKTPAGQYYEALFWKHNDELMQIMDAHPEHVEPFAEALVLFVPELDALLNGDGDHVYVRLEHVESFKAELDWFASMGSSSLKEDIERERQRFPLDAMVGMTMNEALAFVNSNWTPNPMEEKSLVPDSDGEWAYYVHNGVYLEYPRQYTIQIVESKKNYLYLLPSEPMPEQWHPFVMKVKVWEVPLDENTDIHTWYSQSGILWEAPIQSADFQGVEFLQVERRQEDLDQSEMDMHAFLYNPQSRLAVDIWIFTFELLPQETVIDYRQLVNERYEYFQHMVDRLRIQKP